MPHQKPMYKGFYILPNLMTTASLFTAFLGILWAIDGQIEKCALAILFSCLFDGLDGKVARLTNSASDFGVQFDSLADLVAFGVSPAVMIYLWHTHAYGRLGIVSSFMLIVCGALRLARFNVQVDVVSKKFFVGLPIPASACTLACLVLFAPYLPESLATSILPAFCVGLAIVLSLLMVSNVRYASFKDFEVVKAHRFSATVTVIMLFILVASEPKLLGFIFFIGYILSGPIYSYIILPLLRSYKLRRPSARLS
ncbi:CDP-diacylglycerol--serine O-phosphatidyltransferase [Desulfoplanes formicivorans]|uniref:CDP-diacylglycerol--serine O-phosphatidyltransferase n=1 Tax=Desulfoplanes formicivorans TaxID=1592317 RepID=A0A194AIQ4_9BACT|nr:CDP-diacylglycerol--serine O-phosphatidyltransferase [Desulfoplanes formicivorans]GAU09115.1 CDP-diacylglycerol--serine O-phosphatidyltransferase [Desulfoplanes formicivorans]